MSIMISEAKEVAIYLLVLKIFRFPYYQHNYFTIYTTFNIFKKHLIIAWLNLVGFFVLLSN